MNVVISLKTLTLISFLRNMDQCNFVYTVFVSIGQETFEGIRSFLHLTNTSDGGKDSDFLMADVWL